MSTCWLCYGRPVDMPPGAELQMCIRHQVEAYASVVEFQRTHPDGTHYEGCGCLTLDELTAKYEEMAEPEQASPSHSDGAGRGVAS